MPDEHEAVKTSAQQQRGSTPMRRFDNVILGEMEETGDEGKGGMDGSSTRDSTKQSAAGTTRPSSCFRQCCRGFNVATLTGLQLVFVAISAIVSAVLTQQSYNTTPSSNWVLIGGLTSSTAAARVRLLNGSNQSFVVSPNPDLSNPVYEGAVVGSSGTSSSSSSSSSSSDYYTQALQITNLSINTQYYYGLDNVRRGTFQTPGPEGESFGFRVIAAGCAWTGSKDPVFERMANESALLFLHLGDLHYEDISANDVSVRMRAIDVVLGSPSQAKLFGSTALAYMWDDHDWLGNDSEGTGSGRDAALQSYQIAIPHYTPLPDNSSNLPSPYQAFTIGKVRFILMDLRSQASDTSIYSAAQRQWLFDELDASADYDLVILVSSKPWIDKASTVAEDDSWAAYPSNRSQLSDHISNLKRQNVLMIASDAHMVAFDDGSNTYYGTNQSSSTQSFPLLQTGPMDRLGSAKGGPFTDGCHTVKYERNHQYSVLDFATAPGTNQTCLTITSKDSSGTILLTRSMCGNIFHNITTQGSGSCTAATLSSSATAMLGASCALLVALGLGALYFIGCWIGTTIFVVSLVLTIVTFLIGVGIPLAKGISQFDTTAIGAIVVTQVSVVFLYVVLWARCTPVKHARE